MKKISIHIPEANLVAHQPDESIEAIWQITGAKAAKFLEPRASGEFGFDTAATVNDRLGQLTIDNLIGANEVVATTAFGAVAMGAAAFGFVLKVGNIRSVRKATVEFTDQAGVLIKSSCLGTVGALPDTLAPGLRVGVTPGGHIVGQIVLAGLDVATAGSIAVSIEAKFK